MKLIFDMPSSSGSESSGGPGGLGGVPEPDDPAEDRAEDSVDDPRLWVSTVPVTTTGSSTTAPDEEDHPSL